MAGPLSGVKILDLSSVVAGPLSTTHLADQGADVIKIEPLGGDINRRSRQKVSSNGEFSALFISTNRGKRSMALDLKSPEAQMIVRKLVERMDVLVQNFRPGAMERIGLAEPALRKINPRLIYVSISGVGESGPYAKKRIYDPMIQALSGLADIQMDQRTQRPQMIRTILADKTTAIYTAQAVTAALYAREKTGRGQHVRISLLSTMISHLWPEGMMPYTVVGLENLGLSTNSGPDLIFATSDGYITVGTISDSEWQGFCAAVEQPQLASDERFSTAELRSRNATERITLMGTLLKAYTSVEALARLDAADVPCAPVLRRQDILDHEQVVAMRLIEELEQPTVGRVRQPRPAARFDDTALGEARPAPCIGQHSGEILAELGFDQDAIEGLENQKVVRLPT
jgi:crotonobetainyl-CoA:carnitine CoA-transferase CaiB-like acyl-CoA transferase